MLNGQQVTSLLDSDATHNFVSDSLVARGGLPLEDFSRIQVIMADGFKKKCNKRVPQMSIEFDDYTITNDFCMIGIVDSNIILGIQWLHSLGRYIQDLQQMQLEFMVEGKRIILKALVQGWC